MTLLIGVNNQYRGRSLDNYAMEFKQLLDHAIAFAGGNANRVIVLSIPDWGATPFAEGRDNKQIAKEIDEYNAKCREITLADKSHFIDITPSTREHGLDRAYLAPDGLHPSSREYTVWAEQVAAAVPKMLKQQ